jgi:hypothetical protein
MTTHRDVTKPPIRAFASAEHLRDFYEFSFRFDRKHFDTALSNLISINQLVSEDPEDAETLLIQLLQITKKIKARASNTEGFFIPAKLEATDG